MATPEIENETEVEEEVVTTQREVPRHRILGPFAIETLADAPRAPYQACSRL